MINVYDDSVIIIEKVVAYFLYTGEHWHASCETQCTCSTRPLENINCRKVAILRMDTFGRPPCLCVESRTPPCCLLSVCELNKSQERILMYWTTLYILINPNFHRIFAYIFLCCRMTQQGLLNVPLLDIIRYFHWILAYEYFHWSIRIFSIFSLACQ